MLPVTVEEDEPLQEIHIQNANLWRNYWKIMTYPQGQNQRKTKKYAGKYTRNKYLYRVFAASFILLISGNKPISIPLWKK